MVTVGRTALAHKGECLVRERGSCTGFVHEVGRGGGGGWGRQQSKCDGVACDGQGGAVRATPMGLYADSRLLHRCVDAFAALKLLLIPSVPLGELCYSLSCFFCLLN